MPKAERKPIERWVIACKPDGNMLGSAVEMPCFVNEERAHDYMLYMKLSRLDFKPVKLVEAK